MTPAKTTRFICFFLIYATTFVVSQNTASDSWGALQHHLEELTTTALPAVVHIEVSGYGRLGDEENDSKTQMLAREHSSGSGVIVSPDGYILTAYHVIEGARTVRVELNKSEKKCKHEPFSKSFRAQVVGGFKEADIAVLRIDDRNLPSVPFADSGSLKQGQIVAEFGSPEGLANSLSTGVVSAVARQIEPDDPMTYVQTDAAQAPGSSGGPLLDMNGELVGIVVFSLTDRGKHEGLGFAVPVVMAKFVFEQVREHGSVRRVGLGYEVQGVTPLLASALHLPIRAGVMVTGAPPEAPAQMEMLQAGDVIVSINGEEISTIPQLHWVLLHKQVGDRVQIEFWRQSKTLSTQITLSAIPSDDTDPLPATGVEQNRVAKLGIMAVSSKKDGIRASKASGSGVMVTGRIRGSESPVDLNVGDVIHSVNAVPVRSVSELRDLLSRSEPGDAVALELERNGKPMYVAFEME